MQNDTAVAAETALESLSERMERLRDVVNDLSRDIVRNYGDTPAVRAMAEQILDDADAVLRALKRPKY